MCGKYAVLEDIKNCLEMLFLKQLFLKKRFFCTVSAFSAVAVILRFFQLCYNVESKTGFYVNPFDVGRIFFVAILISAFVFGFIWAKSVKKRAIAPLSMKFDFSSLLSEKTTLAAVTVGFAINTFYEIYILSNPLPTLALAKTTHLFSLITVIFSTMCLVYFMFLTFLIENKQVADSVFCIVIVAWAAFRLLRDFITSSTVFYVSKDLLDIFYLCALLLTAFSLCRLFSRTDGAKGFRQFSIYSPITIVLGFTLSVPSLLGLLFGFESVSVSEAIMNIVTLSLSFFFMRVALHIYKEN